MNVLAMIIYIYIYISVSPAHCGKNVERPHPPLDHVIKITETLHDNNLPWTWHFHASVGDLDFIWSSHRCQEGNIARCIMIFPKVLIWPNWNLLWLFCRLGGSHTVFFVTLACVREITVLSFFVSIPQLKLWYSPIFPHLYDYCQTHECSVACHSSSCTPASEISLIEFVVSWRLL